MFVFSLFCLTSEGGVEGQAEPRRGLCDVGPVPPAAAAAAILNGALVLCNPATSDADGPNPQPQAGLHLPAAAPPQGRAGDAGQPEDVASHMSEECCVANLGKTFRLFP